MNIPIFWLFLVTTTWPLANGYFYWGGLPEFNFWYTVGITDNVIGRKICAGLLMTKRLILTAAKPMRVYDDVRYYSHLTVEPFNPAIHWFFGVDVVRIHPDHKDMWSPYDPFMTRCDMAVLKLDRDVPDKVWIFQAAYSMSWADNDYRHRPKGNDIHDTATQHVSFGSRYPEHIEWSYGWLRTDLYAAGDIKYCSDYFPKEWGRFICIHTWEHYIGCDAGSALVRKDFLPSKNSYDGTIGGLIEGWWYTVWRAMGAHVQSAHYVYGMCSFAIYRDGINVLVFTDLTHDDNTEFMRECDRNAWQWTSK